jgi:hypothetical protein
VFINPFTGEWVADTADNYDISYDYPEWSNALDAADGVLNEKETGVYCTLSEAEGVASTLSSKVNALRDPDYKLVRGIAGTQPNVDADGTEEFLDADDPKIDVSNYSDGIDNDSMFLIAPARQEDTKDTLLGAVAGQFAGHALTNTVYKETLTDVTPAQRLVKSDRDDLRDTHQVIGVEREGSIRLHANTSTSTDADWERDFHRRRIVDQMVLVVKEVGDTIEGDLNDEDTQTAARAEILDQIESFVSDGLLEPNTEDEQNYYVTISEPNADEVKIEFGITPEGVVKTVSATIEVEA